MNSSKTLGWVTISLLILLMAGCARKPPSCGDEQTLAITKSTLASQMFDVAGRLFPGTLRDPSMTKVVRSVADFESRITVVDARARSYDETVKMYTCVATLVTSDNSTLEFRYESQMTESGKHIVAPRIQYEELGAMAMLIAGGFVNDAKVGPVPSKSGQPVELSSNPSLVAKPQQSASACLEKSMAKWGAARELEVEKLCSDATKNGEECRISAGSEALLREEAEAEAKKGCQ